MKSSQASKAPAKKSASKAPAKSASKAPAKSAGKSTSSKSASKGGSSRGGGQKGGGQKGGQDLRSQLGKLFEDSLKDIYWAEKALLKALPKMAKKATAPELKEALTNHLEETQGQVERLEQIFESLGKNATAKKCEAMAGLVKEAEEIMDETEEGAMRDAGIIAAGQKVEHYEIATYGTLRTFAEILGLEEAAALLEETLDEEKAADEKLTEVAEAAINLEAAEGEEGEEEEGEEEDEDEDEDDEDEDDGEGEDEEDDDEDTKSK